MKDRRKKLARLNKKRWKRLIARKLIRKIRFRFLEQYGPFIGERMYKTWRAIERQKHGQ